MSARAGQYIRRLTRLCVVASVISSCDAAGAQSYEFTESGLVARYGVLGGDIYWVDNDRALLIGGKRDDFVVPVPGVKEQRFHLLLWNPKQKSVVVVHGGDIANGSLCFFGGYLRLEYTSDYRRPSTDQRWQVLEGSLGKEALRRLDDTALQDLRSRAVEVNPHTCREYERSKLPTLGFRTVPLLEGDFVSQEREAKIGEVVHWKYWPRNSSPVSLDITPELIGVARYSRYRDSYVLVEHPRGVQFGDKVVRPSWLLDRTGKVTPFSPPSGPWMRGSTSVMPTKAGLFLTSHAVDVKGNGAAGGYLQSGNTLARIISGVPISFDVSPDGCDIALSIFDYAPRQSSTPRIKTIHVCSKGR
jgi:hypothetical protein